MLDVHAAALWLQAAGIIATLHQIRRWSADGTLPFFKLGKKLYIHKGELRMALQKLQGAAVRGESRRARRLRPARSSPSRRAGGRSDMLAMMW